MSVLKEMINRLHRYKIMLVEHEEHYKTRKKGKIYHYRKTTLENSIKSVIERIRNHGFNIIQKMRFTDSNGKNYLVHVNESDFKDIEELVGFLELMNPGIIIVSIGKWGEPIELCKIQ